MGNEEEKKCKPGYNSCSIDGEPIPETPKAEADGKCKPGYNSCDIDGEAVEVPDANADKRKDCKPGYNSCDISE